MIKIIGLKNISTRKERKVHRLVWVERHQYYDYAVLEESITDLREIITETELYFSYYSVRYIIKDGDNLIEFKMESKNESSELMLHKLFLKLGSYKKALDFLRI